MRARSSSAPASGVAGGGLAPVARAFTSPPAEKPRPAPVSTTQPTAGSAAAACSACSICHIISPPSAFSTSGRFMVSSTTPSALSTSNSGSMAASPLRSPGWSLHLDRMLGSTPTAGGGRHEGRRAA